MDRKIINGPGYCAVTEDGQLMEFIPYEENDLNGAVLLGRIDRMMPGMNCAFVDIGRKRNGFLPLNEESGSFTGGRKRRIPDKGYHDSGQSLYYDAHEQVCRCQRPRQR